jgi:RNA polymerase sigma factor (sigma-70 family)
MTLTVNETIAQQASSRFGADPHLTALCSAYANRVRRYLSAFGTRGVDLDDLSQEVFLIVVDKREALSEITRMDLWLREICRKVAAGYRRRSFRQHQVPVDAGAHLIDENVPAQSAALESQQDAERLYCAVNALDDEAKDLIALHELGGLPLVEVAALVECDRKTVRKRLAEANRRLIRLFRDHEPVRGAAQFGAHSLPEPATADRAAGGTLRILGSTADISIGLIGMQTRL